jgi:formylglycine-generating enzyme required for sulfatase activity/nitrate/TMAO reductase-like tetraheme cytochrome c subunit
MKKSSYTRNTGSSNKNRRGLFLFIGVFIGVVLFSALYQTTVYFSSNESCMMCHVHPHAEESWRMGKHGGNNNSGVMVNCVDCHLPPRDNTIAYYYAKAYHGLHHVWGYLTKDTESIDWERKRGVENAQHYVYNASCIACHQNMFPQGISDAGITAHLYYEENHARLNLQCINCHLYAGHFNPNYSHGQMIGVPGMSSAAVDTSLFFRQPATVTAFVNYTEQIPGTAVSLNMIAIPGGTFLMGSPENEPYRNADESPQHEVQISPFFMAEVETTWEQFWAFYAETTGEKTPPNIVIANNLNATDVDGISGPSSPFGNAEQGWGGGDRPAITMTHYAAQIFCQWLSAKTGKTYRLPTEAEWEYAARGGTQTAYFFPGSPRDFSERGFWRIFSRPKMENITPYVIFDYNSNGRTQLPSEVRPNPFGLVNMLGNVMEYTADKYDPNAYRNRTGITVDPIVTEGEEWVVRGGFFGSDASQVRSAARAHTQHAAWLRTDPQQPQSIWWYTDVRGIGFRVVAEMDSVIK